MVADIRIRRSGKLSDIALKALKAGRELKPILESVALLFLREIDLNFVNEGRPKKWEKSQAARDRKGQTLQDTSALRQSIAIKGQVTNTGFTLASGLPYAARHHFGDTKKNPFYQMPSRPFLMIPAKQRVKIYELLRKEIESRF